MRRALSAALLLAILALPAAAAVETVEVTAEGARVRADHVASAAVVATLKAGAILAVVGAEGDWYQVKTPSGQKGWISKSVVRTSGKPPVDAPAPTPTPTPGQETGSWKATGQAIRRGFTAERTSEVTAAAGARGLDEPGGAGGRSDPAAVKRMDGWAPSRDEVRAFIREGKLSPERMP